MARQLRRGASRKRLREIGERHAAVRRDRARRTSVRACAPALARPRAGSTPTAARERRRRRRIRADASCRLPCAARSRASIESAQRLPALNVERQRHDRHVERQRCQAAPRRTRSFSVVTHRVGARRAAPRRAMRARRWPYSDDGPRNVIVSRDADTTPRAASRKIAPDAQCPRPRAPTHRPIGTDPRHLRHPRRARTRAFASPPPPG